MTTLISSNWIIYSSDFQTQLCFWWSDHFLPSLTVGSVSSCSVSQNGSSLLHCQEQSSIGTCCKEEDDQLSGYYQCKFNRYSLSRYIWFSYPFQFNSVLPSIYFKVWLQFSIILLLQVESGDRSALNKLVETVKTNYNERSEEIKKHWGGSTLGSKSQARLTKLEKAKAKEVAKA